MRIEDVLIFLALVLSPLSDFPLQESPLGFLGASPSFLFISLAVIIHLLRKGISRLWMVFFLWLTIMSVYGIAVYGFHYRENLVDKGVRLTILLALFLAPFLLFHRSEILRYGSIGAFLILIFGILWNDLLGKEMFLHGNPNENMRPRGFALESSHLVMTTIALTAILASTISHHTLRIFVFFAGLLLVFFTESKGGILVIFFSTLLWYLFLLLSFMRRKVINVKQVFLLSVLLVLLVLPTSRLKDALLLDIQDYTSLATRTTLFFSSLLNLASHPLGVGTTGYLPALVENIPVALEVVSEAGLTNLEEVTGYYYSDNDKNISSKSFFFDGVVLMGLPFVIIYTWFSLLLLKRLSAQGDWILFICTSSLILGLVFFSSGLGLYAVSFALAWAWQRSRA